MTSRLSIAALAVLFLAAQACGPARPPPDAGTGGGIGGGFGGGFTGGGQGGGGGGGATGGGGGATGGGSGGGGGSMFGWDGGTTVTAARGANFCTDNLRLENVIVTAVENSFRGSQGDYLAQFWVADLNDQSHGIYVDKYYTDPPGPYEPKVGDVINLDGYLKRVRSYTDRTGYRIVVGSQFSCPAPNTGKLTITMVSDGGTVIDNNVSAGFGDAVNGTVRANPEAGGSRVHIPGPLTLSNPSPAAFQRISQRPGDNVYFGFEVTGGILVNNFATYDRSLNDGGVEVRCDWRQVVLDGGSVTFPNGISGVWDTYTHAPCEDGGTSSSCRRMDGYVPGTDAGTTYVLYPTTCADLPGQ